MVLKISKSETLILGEVDVYSIKSIHLEDTDVTIKWDKGKFQPDREDNVLTRDAEGKRIKDADGNDVTHIVKIPQTPINILSGEEIYRLSEFTGGLTFAKGYAKLQKEGVFPAGTVK